MNINLTRDQAVELYKKQVAILRSAGNKEAADLLESNLEHIPDCKYEHIEMSFDRFVELQLSPCFGVNGTIDTVTSAMISAVRSGSADKQPSICISLPPQASDNVRALGTLEASDDNKTLGRLYASKPFGLEDARADLKGEPSVALNSKSVLVDDLLKDIVTIVCSEHTPVEGQATIFNSLYKTSSMIASYLLDTKLSPEEFSETVANCKKLKECIPPYKLNREALKGTAALKLFDELKDGLSIQELRQISQLISKYIE